MRRRLIYALVINALGLLATAAGAESNLPPEVRASIALPAQVQVASAQVSLGDIAVLLTHDIDTMQRLMGLPLGLAPRAGVSIRLERDTLARWIRRRTGLSTEQIVWKGQDSTEIMTASRELSGEDIARAAENMLRQWLYSYGKRIELQTLTTPRDLALPVGRLSLRVRPLSESMPRKHMLVWVDIFVDEQFVRAVPVRFEVGVFTELSTATSDLPGGATVDAASLTKREVDITRFPGQDTLAELSDGPQRLRRPVRLGDVVTRQLVESLPAVGRGTRATLLVNAGAVTLESRVDVLQDGYPGQTVRVRQSGQSVGSVLARVTGPGLLEIQK